MKNLFLVSALMFSIVSEASIICKGKTNYGYNIEVVISDDNTASLQSDGLETPTKIANLDDFWDGHMSGLITAPGFSMKYENHYGCIRNVVIHANVRGNSGFLDTAELALCENSDMPGDICRPLEE